MNTRLLILTGAILLLLATSRTGHAGDFEFRLTIPARKVPAGAPIYMRAEVRNVSGHAILVARGHGDGFEPRIIAVRPDGKYMAGCQLNTQKYHYSPGYFLETLSAGWSTVLVKELSCAGEPGEWVIHAEVSSRDVFGMKTTPSREQPSRMIESHDYWHGAIKSEEVKVVVREPQGVDKEVYEKNNHRPMEMSLEALTEFPESTYAAYKWFGEPCDPTMSSGCFANSDPQQIVPFLRAQDSRYFSGRFKLGANGKPVPDGKGSYVWISAEQVQQDQVDWGERVLKYHPEFPFADELRVGVAFCYILLKKESKAIPYFQAVAENGTLPEHRGAAKKYLAALSKPAAVK